MRIISANSEASFVWSQLTRFPTPQIPDFPRGKHLISCYCKPTEWPITPWTDIKWPSHRYNMLLDFLVHTCYSCLLLKRRHDAVNHINCINVQDAFHLFELIGIWCIDSWFSSNPNKCFDFISPLEMQANLFQGCCTKIGCAKAHVTFLSKETWVLNIII